MALFSFSKDFSETAVLFDIGSASVGAAVVDIRRNDKSAVLYTTRSPLSFQEDLDFDYFTRSMLGVLLEVSLRLQSEGLGGRKVDKVVCTFSSPWFVSQTKLIRHKEQKPFTVSKRLIERDVEKAKRDFVLSSSVPQTENSRENAALIEHHVIQTMLNGYQTANPYGKEAYDVEVALFMSLLSKRLFQKTREVIEKVFHVDDIVFHSFALASFSVVRDLYHDADGFLLMDVSGEVSDVSIVYEGVLYETASFPIGKNSLIREIGKKQRVIPEEAHSSIKLYIEEKLSPIALDKSSLRGVMTELEQRWLHAFKGALKSLGDDLPIPETLFITADSDLGIWFEKTIKKEDFSDVAFAAKPFSLILLGKEELLPHTSFENSAAFDLFLAIEAIFLAKLH